MKQINIWHVANAGVILNFGKLNIGVDILCDQIVPYNLTPESVENQVLDPKYCPQLDYIFFTHEHPDHFNKHKVIEFLAKQPHTKVIANNIVTSELGEKIDPERLVCINGKDSKEGLSLGEGVEAEVFYSTHMGMQYKNIINLCMILKWEGKKILIPGDAEPRELLMSSKLEGQKLDFLIVPFPYITLNSVRKLVKESIRPEQILVIHLPSKEEDHHGLIRQSKEIYKKEGALFPYTVFGEQIGGEYRFEFT